jgi:hypothetical protein
MSLSERDRVRFARQLLLPELGEAGQERLLAGRVRAADGADPEALEVARTYLERAGVSVTSNHEASELRVATTDELERLAGRPELLEAARALAGALAAVHAVQTVAAFGPGAASPAIAAIPTICSEDA